MTLSAQVLHDGRRLHEGTLPRGEPVEVEVLLSEAFTAEAGPVEVELQAVADAAVHARCAVPVRGAGLTAGRRLVVGALVVPEDAAWVTFVVRLVDAAGTTPFDGWRAETGRFAFDAAAGPVAREGLTDLGFPCIFDVLQRYPRPRGDAGDDVEGVVRFVAAGLAQDLGWVFDTPEYRVERELDEEGVEHPDGLPLAEWQRRTILHLSGLYYSRGPRRTVPWADRGLGLPLTGVCNNLTDLMSTFRGNTPAWSDGFGTNPEGLRQTLQAAHRTALEAFDGGQVLPGTIFMKGPVRSSHDARGRPIEFMTHIDCVLRVRATDDGRQFQVFDTGGLGLWSTGSGTLPPAFGVIGGLLKEEGWRSTVADCQRQAWMPLRPVDTAPGPHLASPPQGWRFALPEDWSDTRDDRDANDRLMYGTERPIVRLAVFERSAAASAAPAFLSRPFLLGVPPVALFASVVNLPRSDLFEARWLLQAGYRYVPEPGDHEAVEASADAEPQGDYRLTLEVYNERDGIGRWYRPAYQVEAQGFTTRAEALLAGEPAPYGDARPELPAPAGLDALLAEVLEPWSPAPAVRRPPKR